MAKDAFYFSHDSNAKDDPKCVLLIEQLGLEGYGIFWILIETLRDQPNYKYPVALLPALSRRYNTTFEKMKAVVFGYDLFVVDDDYFFSLSLNERMKKLDAKREQAREAGKISAQKRLALKEPCQHEFNDRSTNVQLPLNISSTSKVNKSKVNKNKINKNIYADVVLLTDEEYKKLIDCFGETKVKSQIEALSLYIQSKGNQYKSHYATILNWERKNNNSPAKVIYQNQNKPTHTNFDQRPHEDDELEKYYANVKKG